MKATRQLHDLGQSLWLDNITRGILDDGTLQRYISDLSVTGLTPNPTILDHAITKGGFYDEGGIWEIWPGKTNVLAVTKPFELRNSRVLCPPSPPW